MRSLHRGLPDLRWSDPKASAKCAIEVGKITEAHIERHRADVAIGVVRVAQEAVYARQALAEHE